MLFEVINKTGATVMHTYSPACVPLAAELECIGSAGHKFKVDGKLVARNKVFEAIGLSPDTTIPVIEEPPPIVISDKPSAVSTQAAQLINIEPKPVVVAKPIVTPPKPAVVKDITAVITSTKAPTVHQPPVNSTSKTKLKPKRLFDIDSVLGNK